jgi:hypothetical protein
VSDEGMVGIPLLLGADSKPLRVLVQTSGPAWRMKAETFKRMTDTQRALRHALNQICPIATCGGGTKRYLRQRPSG